MDRGRAFWRLAAYAAAGVGAVFIDRGIFFCSFSRLCSAVPIAATMAGSRDRGFFGGTGGGPSGIAESVVIEGLDGSIIDEEPDSDDDAADEAKDDTEARLSTLGVSFPSDSSARRVPPIRNDDPLKSPSLGANLYDLTC